MMHIKKLKTLTWILFLKSVYIGGNGEVEFAYNLSAPRESVIIGRVNWREEEIEITFRWKTLVVADDDDDWKKMRKKKKLFMKRFLLWD